MDCTRPMTGESRINQENPMSCRMGLLFVIAATVASCGGGEEVQAISFLGEPLYAAEPSAAALEKHDSARLAFEEDCRAYGLPSI